MLIYDTPIQHTSHKPSTRLLSWLTYTDALTDRLKKAMGSVDLKLMSQRWTPTTWFDKYTLNIIDPTVFQREIMMMSKQEAYWYGRTVIPQTCYQLNPQFFKRLETESVKNLIFDQPLVQRQKMNYYSINRQNIEFQWIAKYLPVKNELLWVRYSEFLFQSQEPFYLFELLLPELEQI